MDLQHVLFSHVVSKVGSQLSLLALTCCLQLLAGGGGAGLGCPSSEQLIPRKERGYSSRDG